MSLVRGIRGATTSTKNTKDAIVKATTELIEQLVEANKIATNEIAAAIFTTTHDLNAEFPAVAARMIGWNDVALMCSHEMQVPDGLPNCIRILMLVNTEKEPKELIHVYLRGAKNLRARGIKSD